MKIENEDAMFNGRVIFRNLPNKNVDVLPNSVTPDVSNREYWLSSGSVVTVTNFLNGSDGHPLNILGDGTTTIANNTHIVTNTGANKLLVLNKMYRFTYFTVKNKWFEDA